MPLLPQKDGAVERTGCVQYGRPSGRQEDRLQHRLPRGDGSPRSTRWAAVTEEDDAKPASR